MNDFLVILTYEFLKFTHHIWYDLFLIISHMILLKFKRYFYIPIDKNLNLQKILLVYNNNIILYNLINLNYYHINTTINNKKIKIIGNNGFIMINHTFLKINNCCMCSYRFRIENDPLCLIYSDTLTYSLSELFDDNRIIFS